MRGSHTGPHSTRLLVRRLLGLPRLVLGLLPGRDHEAFEAGRAWSSVIFLKQYFRGRLVVRGD